MGSSTLLHRTCIELMQDGKTLIDSCISQSLWVPIGAIEETCMKTSQSNMILLKSVARTVENPRDELWGDTSRAQI
jgi:hypothetical protein